MRAIWEPCPCCENFWCTLHEAHAHDCPCPPVEEWGESPYMPKTQPATFGARLLALRTAAGLTQQALAERSGLAERNVVYQLESGRRQPSWATAQRLAKALGVSVAAFADPE